MDALLAAMAKVYENLNEFEIQVHRTMEALQSEVHIMKKEVLLRKEAENVTKDIASLEKFHSTTATPMREYLEQKINTIKAYLYDE